MLRGSCGLALALYLAFVLVLDGSLLDYPQLAVSFLVSSVSSGLLLLLTYRPGLERTIPGMVALTLALNAGLVIWCVVTQPRLFPLYLLVATVLFTFLLGGLLFRVATPLAIGICTSYALAALAAGETWAGLAPNLLLLLSFGSIGAVSCYLVELAERRSWLHAKMLHNLAYIDDLTQLGNRRYFYSESDERLERARREQRPACLMIVDIDNFKLFNDTYGHVAGDGCIRDVAGLVAQCMRSPADLCARVGGEEFVVLLYDCELEAARLRAQGLVSRLAGADIEHRASSYGRVTVSIGLAQTPLDGGGSSVGLFGVADRELYRAKTEGRNCIRPG